MKRARLLSEYDRRRLICADDRCLEYPRFAIKGLNYCGRHAGRAALEVLMNEEEPA